MVRALSQWVFMRIACPTCAATYDVPASRLKPGKKIRCTRCGGEWIYSPAAERLELRQPAEPSESVPPISAMDRLSAAPPSVPPSTALLGAWVLTLVVLVGALGSALIWRQAAMRAWPPSTHVLAPFSQPPPQSAQTAGKKTE